MCTLLPDTVEHVVSSGAFVHATGFLKGPTGVAHVSSMDAQDTAMAADVEGNEDFVALLED